MTNRNYAFLPLLLLGAACASDPAPQTPDPRATYARDIEPLYRDNCVPCHKSGGIAPFVLDTYEAARDMAPLSLSAIKSRTMPPWLVVGDGSCQTFSDSRWLSEEDIETVVAWVEDGMARGEQASGGQAPLEGDDQLGGETIALTVSEGYTPVGTEEYPDDDYRCFLLDPAQDHDRFVVGFDAVPGDPTRVHHMIAFDIDPEMIVGADQTGQPITNALVIESLAQGTSSWPCFGAAGEGVAPSGLPAAWAPGTGVTHYPEGTGLYLAKGHKIVLQIHYHVEGAANAAPDQSTLRLGLADQVQKPGFMLLPDEFLATAFSPNPALLPAGQKDVKYSWSKNASDLIGFIQQATGMQNARVSIVGALPHMHKRGTSMRATLGDACIADVYRWDFDWQRFYFYASPIEVHAGETFGVTCHYDTTHDASPVPPGLGSNDEMCLFGIYVIAEL